MNSMLVIGAGRFGTNLALTLMELGCEVMVVDRNENIIDELAPKVTRAQIGDCLEAAALSSLGVENFDVCFVCISEDFQSSLEITSQLKDLGAKYVVSKADRDIHAKFLKKIGADEVIFPEKDMARRTAVRLNSRNVSDYMEITEKYGIYEISVPEEWVGKSLAELNIRSKMGLNIIGRREGNDVLPVSDPKYTFRPGECLYVVGSQKDIRPLL